MSQFTLFVLFRILSVSYVLRNKVLSIMYSNLFQVVSGLGISAPGGYVSLQAVPSTITTLEFDLLTYEPTAVVLFAQLRANPPVCIILN